MMGKQYLASFFALGVFGGALGFAPTAHGTVPSATVSHANTTRAASSSVTVPACGKSLQTPTSIVNPHTEFAAVAEELYQLLGGQNPRNSDESLPSSEGDFKPWLQHDLLVQKEWELQRRFGFEATQNLFNQVRQRIESQNQGESLVESTTEPNPAKPKLKTRQRLFHPELLYTKPYDSYMTNAVQFFNDGSKFVTADGDRRLRIWDAATGRYLATLTGHESNNISDVAISPDDTKIVSVSLEDNLGIVWDARGGERLFMLQTNPSLFYRSPLKSQLRSVEFSSSGRLILTAGDDGRAMIFDAKTGKRLRTIYNKGPLKCATFSHDERTIATGEWSDFKANAIATSGRLWDAKSGKLLHEFMHIDWDIRSLNFSYDDQIMASIGLDNKVVTLRDAKTGKQLSTLGPHKGAVLSIDFSHDSRFILTASDDGSVTIFEISTGQLVAQIKDRKFTIARFSPDDQKVLTYSKTEGLQLWKLYEQIEL
jgi:WD40 repeat protein